MANTIHTKTEIRKDLRYAREVIRQIEKSISKNDWLDVEQAAQELSGLFGQIEWQSRDNIEQIRDFGCKWSEQIEAEREAIRASEIAKWQKIADKVCADLNVVLIEKGTK